MQMAGLYDTWRIDDGGKTLSTFTVLTTDSSPRLRWCTALLVDFVWASCI